MDRITAKILSLILLFLIIFICTILPIWVSKWVEKKGEKGLLVISVLTCFGGGVFLGAYLMHLHPEARHILEESWLHPSDIEYPVPELIIGAGFFMVLFIEYVIIWYSEKRLQTIVPVDHSQAVTASTSNDKVNESEFQTNAIALTSFKQGEDNVAMEIGDEEMQNGAAAGSEITVNSSDAAGTAGADPETSPAEEIEEAAAQGRSIVLIVALSLDCVLEGMALGLQTTTSGVWTMFVAIISHEFIMAFCLGLELVKYYSTKGVVIGALCYSLAVPIGIAIGMLILETQDEVSTAVEITSGVLLCIAAGCFLYVTFFGIMVEEIRKKSLMSKLVAATIGFLLMAAMAILHVHDDHDDHDHDHYLATMDYTMTTSYVL